MTSGEQQGLGDTPTTWNDLLVRNTTADTGQIPAVGELCSSPDLIPYGTNPAADPNSFLADMTKDYGQNVVEGDLNYFYARGVNLAPSGESGTIHLYWTKASLILWPVDWTHQELLQETGQSGSPVSAAAAGSSFVTAAPLVWTPGAIDPSDHYCLIGRVVTTINPNPLPTMLQMPDFAAWVQTNRGMSWHNLVLVTDPNPPEVTVNVNYNQGATGETVYPILQALNIPNGCSVGFSCGTPGPDPVFDLAPTAITSFPSQLLGIATDIPANWDSNVTYTLRSNGQTLPPDAKLTFSVWYVPPPESEMARRATTDLRDSGLPIEQWHESHVKRAEDGPVPMLRVGQHSMVWSKNGASE